ncbi:MAG: FliG C-terminal domain-containing protein [Bythopirellula sp.]|nr:FliG C-terminal domain-containing protein [Bythopirellula sp.]
MNTTHDKSLRKVAILVASLDETWSERILASLPPQQARSVRQQVDQLTDVDPDEQREIVAEFRQSLVQPREQNSTGVELDASLQERIDHDDYAPARMKRHVPLEAVSAGEAAYLVEMLQGESSQTVAVVLSRLDADRAAELLSHFAPAQQADILERLGELDSTDEQSVRVVEAQVAQWLTAQRRRKERMTAGREMVEQIMSRTSGRTGLSEATVIAARLPQPTSAIASEYRQAAKREVLFPQVRYERVSPAPKNTSPPNPFADLTSSECLARLEKLTDSTLLAALTHCEAQVVSLALLGVSEKLLKRVLRGLNRHEAKQFRQQLRDMGPTRISDILAAQQEVLRTVDQLR